MADYEPLCMRRNPFTSTASGAITGGNVVEVAGSNLVQQSSVAGASAKAVGVAVADATAGGRVVFITRGNVHRTTGNGAITAGDQLVSGTVAGTVRTLPASGVPAPVDINNGRAVVGIALETAADTQLVRWMEF